MKFIPLVLGALTLCVASGALAQKVYRCGPEGRIYQQTACADGKALDASDPRTADQRQAAQAVARSEAKAAAQFDRSASAAPATKGGKAKSESAATSTDKAASSAKQAAKQATKKPDADAKPLVFLAPKPKDAASAAR